MQFDNYSTTSTCIVVINI